MRKAHPVRHTSPQPSPGLQPNADLPPNAHLSDFQIDDHLIGDLPAEAAAHLAVCPLCAHRAAAAAAPLASFQTLTLAWSERQSATFPLPDLSHHKPLWQRQAAWITACIALTLGIALTHPSRHAAIQTAALHSPQPLRLQAQTLQAEQHPSPRFADLQHADSVVPDSVVPDTQLAELQPVSAPAPHPRLAQRAGVHGRAASPAPVETASLILPPREQQISADNRMLQAISDEFGIPAGIPSTLGLTNVSEPVPQTSTLRSLQD